MRTCYWFSKKFLLGPRKRTILSWNACLCRWCLLIVTRPKIIQKLLAFSLHLILVDSQFTRRIKFRLTHPLVLLLCTNFCKAPNLDPFIMQLGHSIAIGHFLEFTCIYLHEWYFCNHLNSRLILSQIGHAQAQLNLGGRPDKIIFLSSLRNHHYCTPDFQIQAIQVSPLLFVFAPLTAVF